MMFDVSNRFPRATGCAAVAALALALAGGVAAQTASGTGSSTFEPIVGQQGKNVIWVPTPPMLIERLMRMAQVTANDIVYDLGSGDGRIAIAAARDFGATSFGLEYNPDMVAYSRREVAKAGVANRVSIEEADIYKADFSRATVVTMYLLPNINLDLRPTILNMKPGTRIASHQFNMGEWAPDDSADFSGRMAYLWIVPAKVEGKWTFDVLPAPAPRVKPPATPTPYSVTLKQEFQRISGHATPAEATLGLRNPTLMGDRMRFSFVDEGGRLLEFSGTVSGDTYTGELRTDGGPPTRFSARRGPA